MMLSGGEKKRLCFATVMAWDPDVLIMDEPTVGQDFPNKKRISEVVRSLTSQGKSVILVSHDVEFLWPLQPRTVMLSKGRVIFDGKAEEAFTSDELLAESSITTQQLVQVARLLGESPTNFLNPAAASSFLSSYRNAKVGC
jgi:energy-coupling factor transport system ATP-binding protein